MLFNLDYDYDFDINYNIDTGLNVDEVLKEDILDNLINNNCDLIYFRDLDDNPCVAKVIDYKIVDNKVVINCDIFLNEGDEHNYKRGKYDKVNYSKKRKLKLINNLGIKQAQLAHATDLVEYEYIKIEDYLNHKHPDFIDIKLYELMLDGSFEVFRHKNLFSEHRDEVSDFEKMTFLMRDNASSKYFLGHKLDGDIIYFNHEKASLERRKDARNLAKLIYQMTDGFSKKELLQAVKNKNVYVKISTVIDRNDKRAYDKIVVDQMNEYTLDREFSHKLKVERNKQMRHYKPHRLVKKQRRYLKRQQIKEGLTDYDEGN